jgi:hypothetical protein
MKALSFIGTAAMLWVGGGIIVHGLEHFGLDTVPHFIEHLAAAAEHASPFGAVTGWLTFAVGSAIVGFIIGSAIVAVEHRIVKGKH